MVVQNLLSGKTALVTGASSGLGVRFATVLAAAGANLVLVARRKERLDELAETLEHHNIKLLTVKLDVTDLESIVPFYDRVDQAGLPIDILVNNAGINVEKRLVDITHDDYSQLMTTNLTAPFFLAQEAAKRMLARKEKGRIINIGSICSFHALHGMTPYCMSKAAIHMMTRCMARDLARYEVSVNAICPGFIETEINAHSWENDWGQKLMSSWPRGRLAQREDLDGALLLFADPARQGITGTSLTVDDGQYI